MTGDTQRSYARLLLAVLGCLTLLRGLFAAVVELSPDEAYYWSWSRQLAWGYFDHPPMVAWLIRAGTALLGDCQLGVRLGALLCSASSVWLVFVITREITGEQRQAFWAAMLLCLTPLFSVGAVVHTPDAPLVLAWLLAVWLAGRAVREDRLVQWILLGAAIGLASLAKLTGLFLLPSLALYLLCCRVGRVMLTRPGPALALLAAVLVMLPNLWWNWRAGGGAVTFQLAHATANAEFSPLGFLTFLGGQAGVVSPLLWIALLLFMAGGFRREVRFGRNQAFLFWCFSAPLFLLCAGLSLVHKVEANWPAVAYLAAIPGAAWAWTGGRWYPRNLRILVIAGLGIAAATTVLIHAQTLMPFLPLAPKMDPTSRLRGWKELAREAVLEADNLQAELGAEGYGPVSALRFYTGRRVFYQRSSARRSQYDLWAQEEPGGAILFLQPRTTPLEPPPLCARAGSRWTLMNEDRQGRVGDFRWWVCEQ